MGEKHVPKNRCPFEQVANESCLIQNRISRDITTGILATQICNNNGLANLYPTHTHTRTLTKFSTVNKNDAKILHLNNARLFGKLKSA